MVAIQMALHYLLDLPLNLFQVVICVDSKAALIALNSLKKKNRAEIVIEIQHLILIHYLTLRGINVHLCWVPSHCGILGNEQVDKSC